MQRHTTQPRHPNKNYYPVLLLVASRRNTLHSLRSLRLRHYRRQQHVCRQLEKIND